MKLFDFEPAFQCLSDRGHADWARMLRRACEDAIADDAHGKLSEWVDLVQQFQPAELGSAAEEQPGRPSHLIAPVRICSGRVCAGQPRQYVGNDLRTTLMGLHPWRKGPLEICGQQIDTEWRSDWKWDRLKQAVELRDRLVLDVGCGNGYFGYRMLEAGASMVIGVDPFLLFVLQHELLKRVSGPVPGFVLPVSDSVLHRDLAAFDVAFSMGVLYHRTSPIDHLQVLSGSVRRGGQVVLETLVIDDPGETVLVPRGRYAMMRNVWFLPSLSMLRIWMERTGLENIRVIDVTATTLEEQRSTEWMTFDSLPDFLDPRDSTRTVEGYPAPLRAVIHATVK